MAESLSSSSSEESVEESLGQPNPGNQLRQAREAQQLTLEDVSDRLKLSLAQLEALENGDMDKLPGLAFVRGYLRGYGKLLGLDPDQLVEDFNALHGTVPQSSVTSINRVKPQAQMGDPMLRISVIIFVLALLGTSFWWWQTQMDADSEVSLLDRSASEQQVGSQTSSNTQVLRGSVGGAESESLPESEAQSLDVEAPSNNVNDSAQQIPADNQPVDTVVAPGDDEEPRYLSDEEIAALAKQMEQQAEPAAATTTSEPVGQTEAAAQALLLIRFNAECWVSIKNSDGKTIFASLMQAGNVLERKLDNLPVELLLGQSASVELAEFRGVPLPVNERSNKGVARLTLE